VAVGPPPDFFDTLWEARAPLFAAALFTPRKKEPYLQSQAWARKRTLTGTKPRDYRSIRNRLDPPCWAVVKCQAVHELQELAQLVGGKLIGDPRLPITGVRPFEAAEEGDLTLAMEAKYRENLQATKASAVLIAPGPVQTAKSLIEVEQPKVAFAKLLNLFHQKPFRSLGISPLAVTGRDCQIAGEVSIHPFVFIGDGAVIGARVTLFPGVFVGEGCIIGEDCVLYSNVSLQPGVRIGRRVILHSGTVIGADGFGYVFDGTTQIKIPQTGTVVIGDDVEIGANSCVDRATFGATEIGDGVKLDNHVHIGHNCRIGKNTVMVAQVGISGSVQIGSGCVFAGHSGVVDHVTIGNRVTVLAKSAVTRDLPDGQVVSGHPAIDHRNSLKIEALTRRLPELYERLKNRETPGKKNSESED
jgi:UDP-3-O-[3-hydroxymyristoyl] glucosamine N-acyltransferase